AEAKSRAAKARRAKDLYERSVSEGLARLYSEVEEQLAGFYRLINGDDERDFQAKLDPKNQGRLNLEVAFYARGLFPPGAYHSEGHQDGMGLCLYLALMNRLLGPRFTLGVLDDVVMSVDQGHRRQVCELLKTQFPGTQFIITTHDRVWMHQ